MTAVQLNDTEIRVLGVLIEKSLTQAMGYPMTLNAIVLGANQKQNREPVVEYTESEVSAALRTLQRKDLAAQAPPSPGARAVRFEHKAVAALHWDRREQAIMCELMLRGRQTAGELRTHASRMTTLPDLPAVISILDGLKAAATPFVEELPREPGRSANRYRHLLGEEGSRDARGDAGAAEPASSAQHGMAGTIAHGAAGSDPASAELLDRIARLENEVSMLRAAVEELRRQGAPVAS